MAGVFQSSTSHFMRGQSFSTAIAATRCSRAFPIPRPRNPDAQTGLRDRVPAVPARSSSHRNRAQNPPAGHPVRQSGTSSRDAPEAVPQQVLLGRNDRVRLPLVRRQRANEAQDGTDVRAGRGPNRSCHNIIVECDLRHNGPAALDDSMIPEAGGACRSGHESTSSMQPAREPYRPIAYGRVRQRSYAGRALVLSQTVGLPFAVRRKSRKRRILKAPPAPFRRNPGSGFGLESTQDAVLTRRIGRDLPGAGSCGIRFRAASARPASIVLSYPAPDVLQQT